jgi:cytochrome c-type biogenesis protein CcmH/NrfG
VNGGGCDGARRVFAATGPLPGVVAVDGAADVRAVAARLGRSEFDVAKVVYGLVSTGVLALVPAVLRTDDQESGADDDPVMLLAESRVALQDARYADALRLAERAVERTPRTADALVDVARALVSLDRPGEALDTLTRALRSDDTSVAALMLTARLNFQRGDLDEAVQRWQRVVDIAPDAIEAGLAREAIAHVHRLASLMEPANG